MTIERFRWGKDQIALEKAEVRKMHRAITLANEALTLLFKEDAEDAELGRAPTDLVDQDDLPEVPVEDVDEFAGDRDNIGMERADVMEALEAATTVLEEVLDDPQLGGALEEEERLKVQVAVDTLNKRHVLLTVRPAEDIGMSVKAIIRNDEGHVLVLRDSYSEYWDLPGGHIMEHESPEDALRREVKEETGLNVTNFTPTVTKVLKLGDETKPVMFFDADAVGEVQLSEEHVGYQWANDDEVLGLNLGVFKDFLLPSPEGTGQLGKEEIMEVGTQHVGGQLNMLNLADTLPFEPTIAEEIGPALRRSFVRAKQMGLEDLVNKADFWIYMEREMTGVMAPRANRAILRAAKSHGLSLDKGQLDRGARRLAKAYTHRWYRLVRHTTAGEFNALRDVKGLELESRAATLFSKGRVERIAQNEAGQLRDLGNRLAYQLAGVTHETWKALGTADVICKELDGQTFEVEKGPRPIRDTHLGCRCERRPAKMSRDVAKAVTPDDAELWMDKIGELDDLTSPRLENEKDITGEPHFHEDEVRKSKVIQEIYRRDENGFILGKMTVEE